MSQLQHKHNISLTPICHPFIDHPYTPYTSYTTYALTSHFTPLFLLSVPFGGEMGVRVRVAQYTTNRIINQIPFSLAK
jgi:hypothetical protein